MAGKKTGDKKWISKAIKRPGALKAKAKAAGKLAKDGDIEKSWIDKVAKYKIFYKAR